VLIVLVLQEPGLRSAASDAERLRLVEARAQAESGRLLKTAQAHLATALRAR
jgi:hypothetical protein